MGKSVPHNAKAQTDGHHQHARQHAPAHGDQQRPGQGGVVRHAGLVELRVVREPRGELDQADDQRGGEVVLHDSGKSTTKVKRRRQLMAEYEGAFRYDDQNTTVAEWP